MLVVDKPSGATSHDVVQRLRRAYATRRVGHAGTLDPLATGVLVVLFGEGTKLAGCLTLQDKTYVAGVRFGVGTDSFDSDGAVTEQCELPEGGLDPSEVERAVREEAERTRQVPPAISALRVGGERAYAAARAGRPLILEPREVRVHHCRLLSLEPDSAEVELCVSKGYYVRSFARDLGARLGVPAHLTSLRRTKSGAFGLDEAVTLPLPEPPPPLTTLSAAAARALHCIRLNAAGVTHARHGRPIPRDDVLDSDWTDRDTVALTTDAGELIGLGRIEAGALFVTRGILPSGDAA